MSETDADETAVVDPPDRPSSEPEDDAEWSPVPVEPSSYDVSDASGSDSATGWRYTGGGASYDAALSAEGRRGAGEALLDDDGSGPDEVSGRNDWRGGV